MKAFATIILILFLALSATVHAQTSWIGSQNNNWNAPHNWTNGVPDGETGAVLGDASFTGPHHPIIRQNASFRSITIGGGPTPITVSVRGNISIAEDLIIEDSGTLQQQSNSQITLEGNWYNSGNYSGQGNNSTIIFSGSLQTISGTTSFQSLTINTGSTVLLLDDTRIEHQILVNGILNPGESHQLICSGTMHVRPGGELWVMAAEFADNYQLSGSVNLDGRSTVNYASTTLHQTISNAYSYGHLKISGGTTKSLAENLPPLQSAESSYGRIIVEEGTLDLKEFTANRGNTTAGGAFILASEAVLKIGGSKSFPAYFQEINLASNSLVIYNGAHQTISALYYGNLHLSSSKGEAEKNMQDQPLTVAGDFEIHAGEGTSVVFTAGHNITVNRNLLLNTSCSFHGGAFNHVFRGNWVNEGNFQGNSSTVVFSGTDARLEGEGIHHFHNLSFEANRITAAATLLLHIYGDLHSTGQGSFIHKTGGNLIMEGENGTISGSGFQLYNLTITETTQSNARINLAGNFIANAGFSAAEGSITFSGTGKTIGGSGPITFNELYISGSITTDTDFALLSHFSVFSDAGFEATDGTLTFNGLTSLSGTAMLHHSVINEDKTLILGAESILGIAGTFTSTGTLDAETTTPNTVIYNATVPQGVAPATYNNLILRNAGEKTAMGPVQVNRDFTIEEGAAFFASAFTLIVNRHLNNHGSFVAENSTVQMAGALSAHIRGETVFNVLDVNKSHPSVTISLLGYISAVTLGMNSGNMFTGDHSVTITQERTGNGVILGTIIRNHSFNHGEAYPFESPQNFILFSSPDAALDSVIVNVRVEEILDFIPGKEAVTREYEVTIPNGSYTDATLRLHYENNELNAFMEQHLALFRHVSENDWDSVGVSSRSAELNYVEKENIDIGIEGRWAMSGLRNIVLWNGLVSQEWEDKKNWTTLSGEDMSNRVPSATDAVYIGHETFTYQPVVNSYPTVNAIQFGGAQSCTLAIENSFMLTVIGSIRGFYPETQLHSIEVGDGTLNIGNNLILSDGNQGNGIELNITNGEVVISDNLIQDTAGAIHFHNKGSLTIKGNYLYEEGNFTPGDGTVIFAGTGQQLVAAVSYNHLEFAKPSGNALFNSHTTIAGDLSLHTGGNFEVRDSLRVMGSISIGENSTLRHYTSLPIILHGDWVNEGNFEMEGGSVIFCGTADQTISHGRFNSLVIHKYQGIARLTGDIIINSNLRIEMGTLDLSVWEANRANPGGTISIGPLATLIIRGIDNYPDNFNTGIIDSSSTVEYSGTMAQIIKDTKYGNLILKNGGADNPKTLRDDIEIKGDLKIYEGASFFADSYTTDLYGNFSNQGHLLPSTGTFTLRGINKELKGNLSINHLNVSGSYITTGEVIELEGNLLISNSGSFNLQNTSIFLSGDLTNRGILQSDGIATLRGTRLQTIQLENAVSSSSTGQIVFDGTIAPVLNSTSNPQFATVHIKNTGGIRASVPWTVAVAMVIHPGASFDGGSLTHTFNGHFYNYGTVSSSDSLIFAPLYFPGNIMLDTGTNFSAEGYVVLCGTQPINMSGTTDTFTNLSIRTSYHGGFTPHRSLTITENLFIESGALFNGGEGLSHIIMGGFTNNGTFNGQSSVIVFAGEPTSMEGAGSTHFHSLTIEETADFFLRKTINIEKDFMLNTTDFNTLGNGIVFSGNTASTINSSVGPVTFDYLGLSKENNSTTELMVPVFVANDLVLTQGILTSTEDNLLTLVHEAWTSPGNAASYVDGPMSKKGNEAFVFPLGNEGIYARIGISAPLSEEAEFRARYYANPFRDTLTVEYPLHVVSHKEHWILDRIKGEDNVNVTLYWENSNYSGVRDLDDIVVARYDGEKWMDHTNLGGVSETLHKGFVTSEAITEFSPFTLGSTSDSNPLPVEFLKFSAHYHHPVVELHWTTASEVNNDFFTVERSRNGIEFETLEKVSGAGTSSSLIQYNTMDPQPLAGISYYRIKQTDFDGTYKYSHMVAVSTNLSSGESKITVFPNPAKSESLNVRISNLPVETLSICIFNLRGLQVFSQDYTTNGDFFVQIKPELPASLSPGQYLIRIKGETFTEVKPIIIY